MAEGCCLEQELISLVGLEEQMPVKLPGWFAKLVERFQSNRLVLSKAPRRSKQDEAIMRKELQAQLNEWLMIVKKYLEVQQGKFNA